MYRNEILVGYTLLYVTGGGAGCDLIVRIVIFCNMIKNRHVHDQWSSHGRDRVVIIRLIISQYKCPNFFQSLRQWQRSDTVELWVYHSPVMWTPPAKSPGEFGGKKQREPCCIRSSRSWKSPFLYACLRYRHVQSHVFRRVQGRETINLSRTASPAWLRMRFGTENFKGGKRFSESCKDCRFGGCKVAFKMFMNIN